MVPADILARRIAALLLAGHWDWADFIDALKRYLGAALPPHRRSNGDPLAELADDILEAQETPYPPSPAQLAAIIRASSCFELILEAVHRHDGDVGTPLLPPRFAPVRPLAIVPVPPLATAGELAGWLEMPLAQLDWLADLRRGHVRAAAPALQHYTYRWLPKAAGPPPAGHRARRQQPRQRRARRLRPAEGEPDQQPAARPRGPEPRRPPRFPRPPRWPGVVDGKRQPAPRFAPAAAVRIDRVAAA